MQANKQTRRMDETQTGNYEVSDSEFAENSAVFASNGFHHEQLAAHFLKGATNHPFYIKSYFISPLRRQPRQLSEEKAFQTNDSTEMK